MPYLRNWTIAHIHRLYVHVVKFIQIIVLRIELVVDRVVNLYRPM